MGHTHTRGNQRHAPRFKWCPFFLLLGGAAAAMRAHEPTESNTVTKPQHGLRKKVQQADPRLQKVPGPADYHDPSSLVLTTPPTTVHFDPDKEIDNLKPNRINEAVAPIPANRKPPSRQQGMSFFTAPSDNVISPLMNRKESPNYRLNEQEQKQIQKQTDIAERVHKKVQTYLTTTVLEETVKREQCSGDIVPVTGNTNGRNKKKSTANKNQKENKAHTGFFQRILSKCSRAKPITVLEPKQLRGMTDWSPPKWADGSFFTSGPSQFEMGKRRFEMLLDGFGRFSRIDLRAAEGEGEKARVTFASRMMQTNWRRQCDLFNTVEPNILFAETSPSRKRSFFPLANVLWVQFTHGGDNNWVDLEQLPDGKTFYTTTDSKEKLEFDVSTLKPKSFLPLLDAVKYPASTSSGFLSYVPALAGGETADCFLGVSHSKTRRVRDQTGMWRAGVLGGSSFAQTQTSSYDNSVKATGTQYGICTSLKNAMQTGYISVFKIEEKDPKTRILIAKIPADGGRLTYQHSFTMTRDYLIVFDNPVSLSVNKLVVGYDIQNSMQMNPKETTKIHVVRLYDGHVTTVDTKQWRVALHFGNAWQPGSGPTPSVDKVKINSKIQQKTGRSGSLVSQKTGRSGSVATRSGSVPSASIRPMGVMKSVIKQDSQNSDYRIQSSEPTDTIVFEAADFTNPKVNPFSIFMRDSIGTPEKLTSLKLGSTFSRYTIHLREKTVRIKTLLSVNVGALDLPTYHPGLQGGSADSDDIATNLRNRYTYLTEFFTNDKLEWTTEQEREEVGGAEKESLKKESDLKKESLEKESLKENGNDDKGKSATNPGYNWGIVKYDSQEERVVRKWEEPMVAAQEPRFVPKYKSVSVINDMVKMAKLGADSAAQKSGEMRFVEDRISEFSGDVGFKVGGLSSGRLSSASDFGEDEGVLLTLGYNFETEKSSLYVIDAKEMKTVQVYQLPFRLAVNFHNSWWPREDGVPPMEGA